MTRNFKGTVHLLGPGQETNPGKNVENVVVVELDDALKITREKSFEKFAKALLPLFSKKRLAIADALEVERCSFLNNSKSVNSRAYPANKTFLKHSAKQHDQR